MSLLLTTLRNLWNSDSGQRHPWKITARFARLQLRRRLSSKPIIFETVTGTRALVEPTGDFSAITGLYYHQIPDLHEVVFACHALREGDCFLDIGSNQGYWSLLLAGRGIEAHACEPTPVTFANLQKQIALQDEPFRRLLHGHNVALSDRVGRMRFVVGRGQANYLLKEGETTTEPTAEVEVTTLDNLGEKFPPAFIKIDVEGWMLPVIRGGAKTLANPRLIGLAIETFRFADGETPEIVEMERLLAEHGFLPYDYDPAKRVLRPLIVRKEGRQDTLYLRVDDALRARLANAAPVRCLGDSH